jgi:hypothetical protein
VAIVLDLRQLVELEKGVASILAEVCLYLHHHSFQVEVN